MDRANIAECFRNTLKTFGRIISDRLIALPAADLLLMTGNGWAGIGTPGILKVNFTLNEPGK